MAATTLSAGDIAIIGYDADSPDALSFVLLHAIGSGTQIFFSDRNWNGTSFPAAGGGDGTVTYTAGSDLAAGTVVTISAATLSAGGSTFDHTVGDTIYAYQGTNANTPTAFLYAADFADGNTTFNGSLAGTGLTAGLTAVAVSYDSASYAGSTTFQAAWQLSTSTSLLTDISTPSEWIGNDNTGQTALVQPAQSTFLDAPEVQVWVAESGGGEAITHADNNNNSGVGTNELQLLTNKTINIVTSGGTVVSAAGLVGPQDIVLDTVHNRYFVADSDGTNDRILEGKLSDLLNTPGATQTLRELYAEPAVFDNGVGIIAVTVDPNNGILYFGEQNDLKKISYSTTAALSTVDQSAVTLGSIGTEGTNFDQDMAIDFVHGDVVITDGTTFSVFGSDAVFTNYIWKATGLTAASGAGSLTFNKLAFSPDDADAGAPNDPDIPPTGAEAFPAEQGVVFGVDIDPVTRILYFTTESVALDRSTLQDGSDIHTFYGGVWSYALTGNATGTYTNIYQQNGAGITGLLKNIEVDQSGHYYVSVIGNGSEGVYIDSTTAGGASPTQFADATNINGLGPHGLVVDYAPALASTLGATPTYTETAGTPSAAGTPVSLNITVTASDTDSVDTDEQLAGAIVRISNGFLSGASHQDFLEINGTTSGTLAGSGIVYSYSSFSGVLTLTGTATFAEYKTALELVTFTSSGDNPTNYGADNSRAVAWSVSDGLLSSSEQTSSINVVGVDDAPVNNIGGASATGNEDTTFSITGVTITDVDADPANQDITVTLSVAHGTLTLNLAVAGGVTGSDITGGAGAASNATSITITATQDQINATLADATGLQYHGDLNFNTGFAAENLHIVTSDQGFNGTGGPLTDTDDLAITVNPVNDNPNLQPDTTSAVSYTENAAATALFAGENVDTPLADVDQSANYSGGSIDFNITAGAVAGDRISLTGATFHISGGNIQDAGNVNIGTISGNGTSHVTISALTSAATPSVVDALIQSFGFDSTSDNPTNYGNTTSRTVTLTFNDGGNTGSGGALTDAVTQTVQVVAVNDAPVNHLPATPSVNEDVLTTISGISITDVDADPVNQNITVAFSVVHGTLTFNTAVAGGITGANISSGANGTNTVTLTATQDQINATLSSGTGLRYQSDLNFNSGFGTETLHIVTSDNGHTDSAAFPGAQGDTDDLTINVLAVNDNPNVQPDTTTAVSYTENAAATALFAAENVDTPLADVDQSANYAGGSVDFNITAGAVAGDRISLTDATFHISGGNIQDAGNVNIGTISGNGTSHVTISALTSAATPSVVDALLKAFGFDSTSDNPGSGDRTVTLTFNDGGNTGSGGALTDAVTQTVHVTAVNDAPVSTITPTSYSATEQVNLSLKNNGLSVSDVDGNSGNETVTLSVTEGILTVGAGTSGVIIDSGNGTSSVTFHGTLAQLNDLLNTNGTSTVVYNDNTDTPAASATLTLHLDDGGNTGTGGALTSDDTATINITAVNDAPNALMTTDPYSATEQTTLVLKGTGMSVSDVDALGASERVTISVVEGTLTVTVGDSGVTVFSGNGTSSVVVDGTIAQLNALLGAGGTSNLTYIDGSDNPSASTTLTLQINDQGNTGTGGAHTGTDTSTINITAVNDAPVSTITPTSYGGSPNVAISLKNNGLSVSDVDANAGSETVTLSVTSGTLTVTAGGSGAGVAGSGTNSVTITGTITQINALLNTDGTSTVSYVDSVGGTKTLTLLIHDNGNTGGGDLSAQDTAQIVLDTPPVVDLNGPGAGTGATLGYTENAAATAIAPAGVTTDVDSADFNGGALRVSFSANGAAEDQLSILTDGTVTVSSGTVSVGGLAIGTVSGGANGSDLLVTFNTADATPSTVSTLIEHIGYANNSDNPSTLARSVTFLVDDGDGASGSAVATVNITPTNDAPVATITPASYSATEQTALNLKNNGLSVSDVDGNAGSETVTLSVTEGTLNVTAGTSGAIVTNSGTASVTISGTLAQINALLNTDGTSTVSYTDGNDNPAASATLTLAIDDGGNTGGGNLTANDTATINITPVNDAPVATITPASYSATENVALSLKNNGLAVSDIDGNAGSETVTLSVGEGTLNVTSGGSGAIVNNSGTSSVTITGTLAQINALLNTDGTSTVSYTDNNDNPAASTTLTLQIDDNGNTGGGNLTANDTATINITPANDAPVATIAPTSYSATEQTSLSLKNNGLAVSDVDGNAGNETVTLSVTEGTLNVTAGSSGAIVTNSGTTSVTINGTLAQINDLLNTNATSTVSYIDNTDNPSASATLTLLIHDNGNTGGGDLSSSDTATINITPVNDPPSIDVLPTPANYTENNPPVALTPGPGATWLITVQASDPDDASPPDNGPLLGATVTITDWRPGDHLLVQRDPFDTVTPPSEHGIYTGINVVFDWDDTTHTLTFTSADQNNPGDTIIDYDVALSHIYFESTSDDPTNGGANTTRTLAWQIQDAGGTANGGNDLSPIKNSTINIAAVNDAPVAAITPTSYSATEQTVLSLKNNGIAVSDVDGGTGSETVTLSVGEGVLNVTAGTSGAGVAGSGTNSVTITGSTAQINALLNTDGTSTVGYIDNSDTPGASTTLTLLIHDNGNTGTGGDLSSSDTATINITAVNDAPQLSGFGDASSFVENGGSVVLDTVPNASVSDAELNVSGNNYAGATLTVARTGGANPDDSFVGTGSLDLTDVNGSGENVSLDNGATFIGTFTNPGDGSFSITFNANATAANVNSVMRQIAYANGSDNPPTSVQIDFTFSDGNGQPGGQAQGTGPTPGTATASFTVNITQVDDAPVLINVAPTAAYSPGSAGVVLSPALNVFDVDATPPSTLTGIHSATIKIESGFFAGDELFVNLPTSGGFFIVDEGSGPVVTNISVTSNAAGTLILGGTDTTLRYQLVLDAVNYHSTAADPSNGGTDPTRHISWQVNDGALNSQTPNPDPNNLVNETVLHFDVAPTVDLDASGAGTGFTTTFTENGAPIAIVDTDVSVADPDNANLDSATIVLTNAKPADALSIAGALPSGIDSSIDTSVAGQITLRLIGSATLADYQTALGQIRFVNTSDIPDATDRDITVSVRNSVDSNTAHATVHVVSVNDAPVNTVPGGPLNISPTTGNVTITGLSISDVDAGSGTEATVLSVLHGTLTVSAAGGATVLGSGTHAVTVTGTLAAINATLMASGNVLYHADTGFMGVDTLKMVTNDNGNTGSGGPLTDTDQVFINDIGQGALGPSGQPPGNISGPGVLVYHSPIDLNHDGMGDLLFRHTSGPLAGWELNGPVKIADQVISPLGNDWHVAAKTDFNGDGKTDILLRHDNGTIALWTMNGTQKAADQVVSPLGNDWHIAATNDFNGDGKTDILLRHDNGTIALWTMNGATKVADQVVSSLGNDWHIADTADFNGDGKADILLRHDNGTVAIWTMNGATKVADQVVGPESTDWHFLATADFNGDGKFDILWRNDNGSVELWTQNGAQTIADQVVSQMGNDWHYLGVGDFNADGKADILWRHDSGAVAIWEMNNGQKIADQVVSPMGNDWHFAGLTDANADHMTDILWRHDDGTIALWEMNGTHKQVDQVVSHMGNDWVLA